MHQIEQYEELVPSEPLALDLDEVEELEAQLRHEAGLALSLQ